MYTGLVCALQPLQAPAGPPTALRVLVCAVQWHVLYAEATTAAAAGAAAASCGYHCWGILYKHTRVAEVHACMLLLGAVVEERHHKLLNGPSTTSYMHATQATCRGV